jgi:hypothetical protein
MRQRRETVEHPFGTLKMRMGATYFLMKLRPRCSAAKAATTTIPIVFIVNEDPGRRPREHHKRTTGQRTWPRRAAPARMRRSHPRIWRMRRIIEDRERCLQAGWIFGRDRPPKKPRRSGAAKWEERRPKKDHYSLAESSKCVQIDVAFIPHASDPQQARCELAISGFTRVRTH